MSCITSRLCHQSKCELVTQLSFISKTIICNLIEFPMIQNPTIKIQFLPHLRSSKSPSLNHTNWRLLNAFQWYQERNKTCYSRLSGQYHCDKQNKQTTFLHNRFLPGIWTSMKWVWKILATYYHSSWRGQLFLCFECLALIGFWPELLIVLFVGVCFNG